MAADGVLPLVASVSPACGSLILEHPLLVVSVSPVWRSLKTNNDHPTVNTDFLIAHATVAHFVSWRHHFVQSLVEVLSKRACQEDILNMMTRVNDLVGKLGAGPPDHKCRRLW
ncbi:hypothetical protein niasHS_015592 [Heterodera schachtii]|uniref:Caspase family p10 domain-containing protein n=1 Tax=Heterodera schachtii TaxID=97005 RepID=A0ABD2IB25_HETSC